MRKEINNSAGGFNNMGEVVERVRLIHLLSYPVEKIMYDKSSAPDKLKDAIESIIPCFGSNKKLQTFDHFLRKKFTEYHGFTRISRRDEFSRKKITILYQMEQQSTIYLRSGTHPSTTHCQNRDFDHRSTRMCANQTLQFRVRLIENNLLRT